MSYSRTEDSAVDAPAARRITGLRFNSFAAIVLTLLVFGLGTAVNLYTKLPASDAGKSPFAAFAAAVTAGPVVLAVHAVLGTLLVVAAVTAVVRAALTRRIPMIVAAAIALLAVLMAWFAGAGFVGHQTNDASLSMAIGAAVAILGYSVILLIPPAERTQPRD